MLSCWVPSATEPIILMLIYYSNSTFPVFIYLRKSSFIIFIKNAIADLRNAALRGDILAQWRLSRRMERESFSEFKRGNMEDSRDFMPTKNSFFDQLSCPWECGERTCSNFNKTFSFALCPHSFPVDKSNLDPIHSCKEISQCCEAKSGSEENKDDFILRVSCI